MEKPHGQLFYCVQQQRVDQTLMHGYKVICLWLISLFRPKKKEKDADTYGTGKLSAYVYNHAGFLRGVTTAFTCK